MKIKLAFALLLIAVFFLGIAVPYMTFLPGSIVIKSESGKITSLKPLKAVHTQMKETDKRVNINTATKEELDGLPGIGEVLAERIIEYRETNGEFETVEEIMAVSGIGEGKFDGIVDFIRVK